jgi:hypothetical protein
MRTTTLTVAGSVLAFTMGCASSDVGQSERQGDDFVEFVEPAQLSESEALLQALRLQGYPTHDAVIRENDVVVGGDMVFSKAELKAFNQVLTEKGYFCNGAGQAGPPAGPTAWTSPACWAGTRTVHPDVAAKIRMVYDLTFFNLSQAWSWGIRDAAYQWSQAHNFGTPGGIYIDAMQKHPASWAQATITVSAVSGRCPAGLVACTDGGPRGTLGSFAAQPANLNIEPNNIGGMTTAQMLHTLQHEIGHTFGFMHPGVGSQIAGTLSLAQLDPDGDGVLNTVMAQGGLTKPVLEPDDLDSAVTRYPQSSAPVYVPGPANWSWDFCTSEFPCDVGEGDCDTDIQCKALLVCGQDVGVLYGHDASADLCVPAARAGNDSARPLCPSSGSTGSCATPGCPCERLEGDCDNDSECGGRLVCGANNGNAFGKGSAWDFCVEPPTAGCPTFNPGSPSSSFCSTACPCDAGQGDCDSISQCRSGLVCGRNLGASFGLPSDYEVCVLPAFAPNGTD